MKDDTDLNIVLHEAERLLRTPWKQKTLMQSTFVPLENNE